jgi:hypothetical protein
VTDSSRTLPVADRSAGARRSRPARRDPGVNPLASGAGLGEVVMPGVVPALSRTPGRVTGWSPFPGSDNDAVLGAAAPEASGTPAGRARP